MAGLFFSKLVTDIQDKGDALRMSICLPFSAYDFSPPALIAELSWSSPWVPVQYLPQRGPPDGRGEGFRTSRSLQSISGSPIRLPIFCPPSLPAQIISNEKRHFNDTRIIHLSHGDALEQDILHCRKPKFVCMYVCVQSSETGKTSF